MTREINPRVQALLELHSGYREPELLVRDLVAEILQKSGVLNEPPPVAIDKIRPYLNIADIRETAMVAAAVLTEEPEGYIIYVQKGASSQRANFSIFHEMAHVLFIEAARKNKPLMTDVELQLLDSTYQQEEDLCNRAAGEFLMPLQLLARGTKGMPLSWASIREISQRFAASLEAAARRVVETMDDPAMFASWKIVDNQPEPAQRPYMSIIGRQGLSDLYRRLIEPRFTPEAVRNCAASSITSSNTFSWHFLGETRRFEINAIEHYGRIHTLIAPLNTAVKISPEPIAAKSTRRRVSAKQLRLPK